MSIPPPCDSCGELPAAFMIGNTQTGEQLAVCGPDAGRWGLAMAMSQLTTDELADMIEALGGPPPENGQAPTQEVKPARKPGRPRISRAERERRRALANDDPADGEAPEHEHPPEPAQGVAQAQATAPD